MDKTSLRNSFILLLTATIWGFSFVAQSKGMEHVGPLTFNGVRALLGSLTLLPLVLARNASNKKKGVVTDKRTLWRGGLFVGLFLFFASNLQQYGILYTSVGKAGFITALYIVLVPIFGLFLKRKTSLNVWVSAVIALIGLYLLCIKEGLSVNTGDILVFGCAVLYAGHILTIDHYAAKTDGVTLSFLQFLISGTLSLVLALIFEKPNLASILQAWAPIAYAGILSCGVAYTLQIIGQKGLNPAVASLIMSLESCIAVLAGWLLLQERLSARELIGCAVMFGAIILAQFPFKKAAAQAQPDLSEN